MNDGLFFKFSDDGEFALLYSKNEIRIINSKTGAIESSTLEFNDIFSVYFHPEKSEEILVSTQFTKPGMSSTLWNWKSKKVVHSFPKELVIRSNFNPSVFYAKDDILNLEGFVVPCDTLERRFKVPCGPNLGNYWKSKNRVLLINAIGEYCALDINSGSILYHSKIPERAIISFAKYAIQNDENDQNRFAILADKNLYIYDAQSGQLSLSIPVVDGLYIDFLPNNRIFTFFKDKSVKVWNCETADLVLSTALQLEVQFFDFTLFSNSELLAVIGMGASDGYECHVYRTSDFSLVKSFPNSESFHDTQRGYFIGTKDNRLLDYSGIMGEVQLGNSELRLQSVPSLNVQGTSALARSEPIYDQNSKARSTYYLFSRHRPEPWWGLAWLPEFWTTLALAIAFLWNLFRARRPSEQKSPAL